MASRLDPQILSSIRSLEAEGTPGLLKQLIQLFYESSADFMARLKAGLSNRNSEQLRSVAHSLKSSAAGLGARDLASLCQKLENHSTASTVDQQSSELISQIEIELQSVLQELKSIS